MSEELWKDVEGYVGYYKISNYGNVMSISRKVRSGEYAYYTKDKLMKGCVMGGYISVSLRKEGTKKSFRVHRLVAKHFIDNPKNKPQVNHIDEVRTNNHHSNLEWVTQQENVLHTANRTVGLKRYKSYSVRKKELNSEVSRKERLNDGKHIKKCGRKPVNMYNLNGKLIRKFDSLSEAEKFGFHRDAIIRVCKGEQSQYSGYLWEFCKTEIREGKPIPINMYTLDNVFVKSYPSITSVVADGFKSRSVSKCCAGKISQHKGYIFKRS